MPLEPALLARLGFALFASAVAPTDGTVELDSSGRDPFAAALLWTVQAVFGGVLGVFLVPDALELVSEEALDFLERDMLVCAALWRHVRWISGGEDEGALDAGVAHAVGAGELDRFVGGDVVRETDYAFDQLHLLRGCWRWWRSHERFPYAHFSRTLFGHTGY